MIITKIAKLAGLQAKNKEAWEGKVLIYGPEFYGVTEDPEITHVEYPRNDGRPSLIFPADKLKSVKGQWAEARSNGRKFLIYKESDLTNED